MKIKLFTQQFFIKTIVALFLAYGPFYTNHLNAQFCEFFVQSSGVIPCNSNSGWASISEYGIVRIIAVNGSPGIPIGCEFPWRVEWQALNNPGVIIANEYTIMNLTAGNYAAIVYHDVEGIPFTDQAILGGPYFVTINEDCSSNCMFVNSMPSQTSCEGSNGEVSVELVENENGDDQNPTFTASLDCDGSYSYYWEDLSEVGVYIGNSPVLSGLDPGMYSVTVCDESGNTGTPTVSASIVVEDMPDDCIEIYSGYSMVEDGCVFRYGGEEMNETPFGILDPCSCNDDQSVNGAGDGTFFETVEVTGPPNLDLVIGTDVTGTLESEGLYNLAGVEYPLYSDLTETAPGSGVYQISGDHIDQVGYTVYIMIDLGGGVYAPALDPTGNQLSVSNTCEYPIANEPLIDVDGVCFNGDPIDLNVVITEANGHSFEPTTSITIDGNAATTFDPGILGDGTFLVEWTVSGTFEDDAGGTQAAPAFPGCETTIQQTITIGGGDDFSCNNHVNVTIAANCDINLNPSMFISSVDDPSLFTITFAQQDDTPIDEGDLQDWLGQKIKYIVTDNCTGYSCWGYLTLEDKTAPEFPACSDVTGFMPDTTITCEEFAMGLNPQFPEVLGAACDMQIDTIVSSDTLGLACARGFAAIIRRQYTVVDQFNNVATCFQNINVEKKDLIDIDFPSDTVIKQSEFKPGAGQLICDIFNEAFLTPDITGAPTCLDCPNIKHHYTDVFVPLDCETEKKFVRTWLVIDWCTGEIREEGQLIETLDDVLPIVNCGETCLTILTDPGKCTATYTFPIPVPLGTGTDDDVRYEDCSEVSWTISYAVVPATVLDDADLDDPCAEDFIPTTPLVYTEVLPNANGEYVVTGLPLGLAWFKYDIFDACGNRYSDQPCTKDVLIKDGNPPTAWCEGFSIVPLDGDGYAEVFATSVDDHSEDLCGGDLEFAIKRITGGTCTGHSSDRVFGESVHLCCSDLGGTVSVELRVTDEDGNTSTCIGQLQPTFDPGPLVVVCPTDRNLDCGDDYTDYNLIGSFTIANTGIDPECFVSDLEIANEQFDTEGLNECGYGVVIRSFDVVNAGGSILESCIQTITIDDDGGLKETEITWPDLEITVDACGNNPNTSPGSINSKPRVDSAADCIIVAISHEDGKIMHPGLGAGYCASFIRTWTVTDWCTHTDANPNGVNFTFEQTIFLNDTSKPTFTSNCEDVTVYANDYECEAFVPLIVFVQDACHSYSELLISWEIDVDNDGDDSNDINGTGPDASGVYPAGTHKISFTAIDGCGNESDMCMYTFTVVGDQNPTPICYADIIWSLDSDGSTEVWASDFDIKSTNGCGSDNELIFSFTPPPNLTPALEFDCDDIPNKIGVSIPLEVFVVDAATGIYESCVVVLELQDNKNVCPDNPNSMSRVSGKVMNPEHEGVENFEVMLENMTSYDMTMEMTQNNGDYAFESVAYYNEYKVEPYNNKNPLNGVSTLDLVYIQKHIIGLSELNTPYQLIAADVNDSGEVSAIDLIELRKLILGVYNEYPSNTSWVFVPDAHDFADVQNPYDYPRGIQLEDLYTTANELDFIAVKVGDVNGSVDYVTDGTSTDTRSGDVQLVVKESRSESADGSKWYDLVINEDIDLLGMQFTFEFDPTVVEYQSVIGNKLSIRESNVALFDASNGKLSMSYDNIEIDELKKGDVLMTLAFDQIRTDLDKGFAVSSVLTTAEMYDSGETIKGIELIDGTITNGAGSFEVYQNQPNPFGDVSTIGFYTPQSGTVALDITDANGRLLYQDQKTVSTGYNSFRVSTKDLESSGMLFYRVQTEDSSITRKMIVY